MTTQTRESMSSCLSLMSGLMKSLMMFLLIMPLMASRAEDAAPITAERLAPTNRIIRGRGRKSLTIIGTTSSASPCSRASVITPVSVITRPIRASRIIMTLSTVLINAATIAELRATAAVLAANARCIRSGLTTEPMPTTHQVASQAIQTCGSDTWGTRLVWPSGIAATNASQPPTNGSAMGSSATTPMVTRAT